MSHFHCLRTRGQNLNSGTIGLLLHGGVLAFHVYTYFKGLFSWPVQSSDNLHNQQGLEKSAALYLKPD